VRRSGPLVTGLLTLLALLSIAAPAGAASLDRAIARQLARAGGVSGAYVLDTTTGATLAAVRADVPRIPASVEKLSTATAVLQHFGAAATLQTTVLGAGTLDDGGTWHGDLYLHGGGDPTLGSATFTRRAYGTGATLADLAAQLQAAGIGSVSGRILGDESLLDRLRGAPASGYALDVADLGGPLSGLLYDRGLARENGSAIQTHPATFAAQQLAAQLRKRGIHIGAHSSEGIAPPGAQQLATVSSPPMATLLRLTLGPSDNLLAELLVKDLGAHDGATGSTAAGAAVVRATLARLHVSSTVVDGSGLSRGDRESPRQVVTLLAAMRTNIAFAAALPVAGRSGTLALRMRHSAAQDHCKAKTGTLSNVSALAGYCHTPNGHLLAFAFMENHVHTARAKAIENILTITLARQRPVGSPLVPPLVPVTTTPVDGGAPTTSAG
jgi:D-alanyl-D-alanine carboxypeptidase/D-alanyl-D-alanine-endopeptidase (penicillin-binding protein 4)